MAEFRALEVTRYEVQAVTRRIPVVVLDPIK